MVSLMIFVLISEFLKCSLGYPEIKKVNILWNDWSKVPRCQHGSSGELYLRVAMSGDSQKTNLWSLLKNDCLQIMDMIDWSRSHPDSVHDFCLAYGIDAGWKYFLNVCSLNSIFFFFFLGSCKPQERREGGGGCSTVTYF